MASIIRRPNGHKWIQFERKTLRLGKCDVRCAKKHKELIEAIIACRNASQAIEPRDTLLLGALPDNLRSRYEACGLVGARDTTRPKVVRLGEYIDGYFASHGLGVKQATKTFWSHTRNRLVEFFDADRDICSINADSARKFHVWLSESSNKRDKRTDEAGELKLVGLSPSTVCRRIGLSRQIFKQAVDDGIMERNPFAGISAGVKTNGKRQHYVEIETFIKVLRAAPDRRWRALLVLARMGALRVPSEIQGLKWSHINWETKRMTILSPKTERYLGGESRVIPLIEPIANELKALRSTQDDAIDEVFPGIRSNSNLRTTLEKIISRADVPKWPRLWQNLRASAATDLARDMPPHIAAAICGHSVTVAERHYWKVTDSDFETAIQRATKIPDDLKLVPKQNPKKNDAAPDGTTSHDASPLSENTGNRVIPSVLETEKWARRDSNTTPNPRDFDASCQPEVKAEVKERIMVILALLSDEQIERWLALGETGTDS